MSEEYACHKKLYILKFNSIDEAVIFAKETWPKSRAFEIMLEDNQDDEGWICVLAVCDICGHKSAFFAPACLYDNGIMGVECSNCGNMSVYPKEGSFEDE